MAAAPPCSPASPSPCSGRSCAPGCRARPPGRSRAASPDASSSAGRAGTKTETKTRVSYFLSLVFFLFTRRHLSCSRSIVGVYKTADIFFPLPSTWRYFSLDKKKREGQHYHKRQISCRVISFFAPLDTVKKACEDLRPRGTNECSG